VKTTAVMPGGGESHDLAMGYILWIFGFIGAHRFYYGKPVSGTIWYFTGGLLLVGWVVDVFLIPGMARRASIKYTPGPVDYDVCWILLTFFGWLGVHRMYMGKWVTGVVWLLTGGFFLLGWLYDFWTLNGQLDEANCRW
jgi:TM2 domain-containing membrane protein YozV